MVPLKFLVSPSMVAVLVICLLPLAYFFSALAKKRGLVRRMIKLGKVRHSISGLETNSTLTAASPCRFITFSSATSST